MSKQLAKPILVGAIVAAAAIITTAVIVYSTGHTLGQIDSEKPRVSQQSIEIEGIKQLYQVGERLNFTINTYGACASPNVSITRNDVASGGAIVAYEYKGMPARCPPPSEPEEPHFIWNAERLVTRTSDEIYGGEGNSIITTTAAIVLKKAGNYTISASTIDLSDSVSKEFKVVEDENGDSITSPVRMKLVSLKVYTTSQELIGDVVPDMQFEKGEPVLFNATFSNTSPSTELRAITDFVLVLGTKDASEMPKPDDFSIVTGATMVIPAGGSISVEHSWLPEKVGNYTVMVFSLRKIDLNSTLIMSPVAAIPIKVVE